jgi:hypothetical protein
MRLPKAFGSSDSRISILIFASLVLLTVSVWSSAARSSATGPTVFAGINVKARQQVGAPDRNRKVVDQERNYANQPVEIVGLRIDGKLAELSEGVKVGAETEWLKGLSWEIKNRSNKNILSIDLYVMFPDTQANGPIFVCPMHYGNDPKATAGSESVEPLKPGDTARFAISNGIYAGIKRHLESRMSLAEVNHVRVRPELIVFDDDTAWSMGEEMHRDPGKPSRWVPND